MAATVEPREGDVVREVTGHVVVPGLIDAHLHLFDGAGPFGAAPDTFGVESAVTTVILSHLRVDSLIVTGCTTSGCVRATVVDGCAHGYRVIVPHECVGDRATGPHEANLFDMDQKYADVVTTAEVMRYLESVRGGQRVGR